jgi:AcrR family transcriptional regulator
MSSVTRKQRGARSRRREEIRDRMLARVEELLADGENLIHLSTGRICAMADIPRSTFYVHFADRGELHSAWLAEIAGRLETVGEQWWEVDGGSGREDVLAALDGLVRAYRPHAVLMRELYAASAYDPALRAQVQAVTGRNINGLRRHIVTGQRAGWICPELPAAETAGWLMCMAARGQHKLVAGASDDELARYVTGLADIVWYTLYAFAPGRTVPRV